MKIRKRGPAPRGEYAGKSAVLSTRIQPETRGHLVGAAKASGRSLSQEIEYRLQRTFIEDKNIIDAFGSRRNYALMKIIASVIEAISSPSEDWMSSSLQFDQVQNGLNAVLDRIRPRGPEQEEAERRGGEEALAILKDILTADRSIGLAASREERTKANIRGDMGEILDRVTAGARSLLYYKEWTEKLIAERKTELRDHPRLAASLARINEEISRWPLAEEAGPVEIAETRQVSPKKRRARS